jgi:hypothetical protein
MIRGKCETTHGIKSFNISIRGARATSPACRWLDIWHKTKGHIWLFHIASVVIVKQQDGDKRKELNHGQ